MIPELLIKTIASYLKDDIDVIKLSKIYKFKNIKFRLNGYFTFYEFYDLGLMYDFDIRKITEYSFYENYNYDLTLPINLEYLGIDDNDIDEITFKKFKKLKSLHTPSYILEYIKEYPPNLEKVEIDCVFWDIESNIKINQSLSLTNIVILKINKSFNENIDNLPKTLKILIIDQFGCNNKEKIYFNQRIDKLPENLQILDIYSDTFNQKLDNLPIKLQVLKITSNNFNQKLNKLPKHIKILEIISLYYDSTNIELNEVLLKLKKIKKIKIISCKTDSKSYKFNGLPEYFSYDKYKYEDGLKYLEKLKNIYNEIDSENTKKIAKNTEKVRRRRMNCL